jgi:hypothetical protein
MSSYTTLSKLPDNEVLSLAISLDQEQQAATPRDNANLRPAQQQRILTQFLKTIQINLY